MNRLLMWKPAGLVRSMLLAAAVASCVTGTAIAEAGKTPAEPLPPTVLDEILDPELNVTLTPQGDPLLIPAAGGRIIFGVRVDNREELPADFAVWTSVILPNGSSTGPLSGPLDIVLPSGWSAGRSVLTQNIPAGAPSGTYTYLAHAGVFSTPSASDSFTFEKLPASAGWYSQSPGASYTLTSVWFTDTENGWAVSDYREIVHTVDGGDTWTPQDDQQYYPHEYHDICFTDEQTGWMVGHGYSLGGTILHTTDGGANWTDQQPDDEYKLNGVFFTDADNGWAVGGYFDLFGSNHRQTIQRTSDGGQNWNGQYYGFYEPPLEAVWFTDTQNGWAVGGQGAILHTANGGANWTEQTSGTSSDLRGVFFLNALTGWCVGDEGAVRYTSDGGATWSDRSPGTSDYYRGVWFVDGNNGWVVGGGFYPERGIILRTSDGGVSWEPQEVPAGGYILEDIHVVGTSQGWASGGYIYPYSGVMLHTE